MTGGIIPLAATLATDVIFNSFIGESKVIYGLFFFFFFLVSFSFLCVS